jgi:hypothetical protein
VAEEQGDRYRERLWEGLPTATREARVYCALSCLPVAFSGKIEPVANRPPAQSMAF